MIKCEKFFRYPSKNPETNRKIEINGPTYKKLEILCGKYEKNSYSVKNVKNVKKEKVSTDTCDKWLKNPITNRKIASTGLVYKKLEKECTPIHPKP